MKNVRVFLKFAMILLLLIAAGCSNDDSLISSEATHIKVLEKKHSEDYEQMWIVASYANDPNNPETIEIFIEEPMLWNLIEENREYFVLIITEDGKSTLGQMSYPGDENALR